MSSKITPLTKIILLSSVLALGFLFVVLAGAIYGNWSPLALAAIFGVAYLPVIISSAILGSGGFYDDLMNESSGSVQDLARFVTSFLIISGVALPLVLCHSHQLTTTAAVLTEIGGSMILGTVVTFTRFFSETDEDNVDI